MKLGIFNEFVGNEKYYVNACESLGIEYEVIDIISDRWIENLQRSNCDGFLVRPSAAKDVWKTMYDEKLYFITEIMGKLIYPSYKEIFIYENKKNMSYWLRINEIKHPKTWVFYNKQGAISFIEDYENFPLVFKPNIGSGAIGIKFVKNKIDAKKLVNDIFTKFRFFNRGYTKWYKTKYGISLPLMDDKQYNFVIFQEKIEVKNEWRMIKIGESYFGHQKLLKGNFHSGSMMVGWVGPPEELLDLCKYICDIGEFSSMNVDIFEDVNGAYYVNELQTMFGSHDDSQMYIDGIPGRYLYKGKKWVFEEGIFNGNGSCNLRVNDFIKQLETNKQL